MQPSPQEEVNVSAYTGGNEVFFSFFQSLLEGIDQGLITGESLQAIIRNWGASLAQQAQLPQDLPGALQRLRELFVVMGLVRVFEPGGEGDSDDQVMVLRCLPARFLVVPRVKVRLPRHLCLVQLLVEGALQQAGLPYTVTEQRQGMLRSDECILRLSAGEKS